MYRKNNNKFKNANVIKQEDTTTTMWIWSDWPQTNYCCNALINHTCLEIIKNQCDREINSTNVSLVHTTTAQKHNQLRHGFMRHRTKAWRQVMKPRLLSSLAYTLQLHEGHLFIFIQRANNRTERANINTFFQQPRLPIIVGIPSQQSSRSSWEGRGVATPEDALKSLSAFS